MEGAFTLAGPRLDWETMVGVLRLIWLDAVVMLKLNVLGMKMVTRLGHLGDTGAEDLHLSLEIDLRRRSPLGAGLVEKNGIQVSIPTDGAKLLMLFFEEGKLREKGDLPSEGKGSGPSIKASLHKTK
ncbi:unnamed protein product [Prunus brigantina]